MTSEHYLREIAEMMKEMNQRLARIESRLGAFPELSKEWPKRLWRDVGIAADQASYDWMLEHGWGTKE